MISDRTYKATSPSSFNDPFDMPIDADIDFDAKELNKPMMDWIESAIYSDGNLPACPLYPVAMLGRLLRQKMSRIELMRELKEPCEEGAINSMQYLMENREERIKLRNHSSVICLSEVKDDLLMWAHYAEHHKGAVIKLKCVPEIDNILLAAKKVSYQEDYPLMFGKDAWFKHMIGETGIEQKEWLTLFASTKSIHWDYEKEWRVILFDTLEDGQNCEFIELYPAEVESIYVGCCMTEANIERIQDFLTGDFSHVNLFKAKKNKSKFAVEFDAI